MKLDNQIALVTGGDSGIGQAIATLFAEAGADLCITYHTDADGAAETRRRIEAAGRQALVAPLDVRDAAAVDALFARVARELGVPDVLVNNAGKGMGAQVPVADLPDDQVAVILDTNLKGPLHCARAFVRQRRERGGDGVGVVVRYGGVHDGRSSFDDAWAGLDSECGDARPSRGREYATRKARARGRRRALWRAPSRPGAPR